MSELKNRIIEARKALPQGTYKEVAERARCSETYACTVLQEWMLSMQNNTPVTKEQASFTVEQVIQTRELVKRVGKDQLKQLIEALSS